MKPTIGRIVNYIPTEKEKEAIQTLGLGNSYAGMKLPAIIVAVWGENEDSAVNLKVLIDGKGEFWKTSICVGKEENKEGSWYWPTKAL